MGKRVKKGAAERKTKTKEEGPEPEVEEVVEDTEPEVEPASEPELVAAVEEPPVEEPSAEGPPVEPAPSPLEPAVEPKAEERPTAMEEMLSSVSIQRLRLIAERHGLDSEGLSRGELVAEVLQVQKQRMEAAVASPQPQVESPAGTPVAPVSAPKTHAFLLGPGEVPEAVSGAIVPSAPPAVKEEPGATVPRAESEPRKKGHAFL